MTTPLGIPSARQDDTEDVAWALQTADTLWRREERVDAIVWLRRAATAAGEAEADDRALELARAAAELSEWMAKNPVAAPSPTSTPSEAPDAGGVDDLLTIDVDVAEDVTAARLPVIEAPPPSPAPPAVPPPAPPVSAPPTPPPPAISSAPPSPSSMQPEVFRSVLADDATAEVPSAAEAHAGMLDPWAQEPEKEPAVVPPRAVVDDAYDDEVVTSAKLVTLAAEAVASTRKARSEAPKEREKKTSSKPAKPPPPKPAKPPPPLPKKKPPVPPRAMQPTLPDAPTSKAASVAPPPPEPEAAASAPAAADLPELSSEISAKPEPTLVSASGGVQVRPPERTHPVVDVSSTEDVVTSVRIEVPNLPPLPIPQPSAPVIEAKLEPVEPPAPAPPPVVEAAPPAPAPPPPPVVEAAPPAPAPVVEAPPPVATAPSAPPPSDAPGGIEIVDELPPIDEPAAAVEPSPNALRLDAVDALSDLPDDAREELERVAEIHRLSRDEEIMGFALAYVVAGAVDVAAQISDAAAERLEAGAVLKGKGTVAESTPLRLVGASDGTVVATWTAEQIDPAFATCPWVEDDLRERANHVQALVGVTLGPLAEHLDLELRRQVTSRLALRELEEGGVEMEAGAPVKELCIVGQGSLELVENGEVVGTVNVGEVLYPQEIMGGGKAKSTVRAAKGGALLLVADRGVAQELMMICPPLIEIFSAM
jgi:hypothetical protein